MIFSASFHASMFPISSKFPITNVSCFIPFAAPVNLCPWTNKLLVAQEMYHSQKQLSMLCDTLPCPWCGCSIFWSFPQQSSYNSTPDEHGHTPAWWWHPGRSHAQLHRCDVLQNCSDKNLTMQNLSPGLFGPQIQLCKTQYQLCSNPKHHSPEHCWDSHTTLRVSVPQSEKKPSHWHWVRSTEFSPP